MDTTKKKSTLENFDRFTVVLLFVLGSCSLGLYLNENILIDLIFNSNKDKVNYVASIDKLNGNLKYKLRNELLWTPVFLKDSLENSSEVYSSDNTSATIQLKDGSKIILGPHTHVFIDLNSNKLDIKLVDGEVNIATKRKVSLSLNNGVKVQAEKGKQLNVKHSSSANTTSFQSKTGGVKIDRAGKVLLIDKNKNIQMSKNNVQQSIQNITIDKKLAKKFIFFTSISDQYQFSAKDELQGKKIYLEVARDLNFQKVILKNESILDATNNIELKLIGKIYYRIAAYQNNKLTNTSSTESAILNKIPKPQVTYPYNNMKIAENLDSVNAMITGACPQGKMELEYSSISNFSDSVFLPVRNGVSQVNLKEDNNYLRPKCTLINGQIAFGKTIQLTKISPIKKEKEKTPPPLLIPIQLEQDDLEIELEV